MDEEVYTYSPDIATLRRLDQILALQKEVRELRKEIALLREERAALLAADRPMPGMEES